MRYIITLLLLCGAVGTAAADGPSPVLSRDSLEVDEAALAQAELGVYWRLALSLRPAEQVTRLALLDEHLYVLTDRGALFAVRAESGLVHWQRPLVEPGDVLFPLTHALAENGPGPVVATTPAWVALLDRETGRDLPFVDPRTGKEQARCLLGIPPSASMVADATYFYGALVNEQFACYRRKDGFVKWVFGAGAPSSKTPCLLPDRVLFAGDKGRFVMVSTDRSDHGMVLWKDQVATAPLERIVGLTSEQRKRLWPRESVTTPLEPVFLSRADLVFTGTDQVVYSIDPKTGPVEGQVRWRHRLGARPTEGPAVVGDLVFQHDPERGLLAIDRPTGRLRWLLPRGRRLLARAGGAVYALGTGDLLLVADELTGSVRERIPCKGVRFAPTDSTADAVFLADAGGRVLCVRKSGSKPLKSNDFLPATPGPATRATTRPAVSAAPAATEETPAAIRPAGPAVAPENDVLRSPRQ